MPEKNTATFKRLFVEVSRFATPLLAILIVVIGVLVLVKPKYEAVKISGALNIKAKQESLSEKQAYLTQLTALEENFRALKTADIGKLEQALPKEEDISGLFVQLENVAVTSGFTLLSVDVSSAENVRGGQKKLQNIKKLNIAMTVDGGNYSALKRLLKEIEMNLRLFDVNSLNFTAGSRLYTLNLSTYYLALP